MSTTTYKATVLAPAVTRGYGDNKILLPALTAKLQITIDWPKLIDHFGTKAARSKGKRTTMLGGRIKIKAVDVKERA